MSIGRFF